jgi:hypothetical protein
LSADKYYGGNFMEASEIIQEIDNLPLHRRILIAEQIMRSVRLDNQKAILEQAAEHLYDDYKNDGGLTEFTTKDDMQKGKSPLEDIPYITADITTQEIVELIREGRAGI